jgi:hypothetical protein
MNQKQMTRLDSQRTPHRTAEGHILLPGGIQVHREGARMDGAWVVKHPSGVGHALTDTADVLRATHFTDDIGPMFDRMLRTYHPFQRRAVRYAGFIIDTFYLETTDTDGPGQRKPPSECGAILCYLFIQFWQQRQQTGDADADFALPMLWRSYWWALRWLMYETDDETFEQVRDRWKVVGLHNEYERAAHMWQQMCIQDGYAWFFADTLCGWMQKPCARWQVVREREVQRLLWQKQGARSWFGRRQLHPDVLQSTSARRRLEDVIEHWYLPRYDLQTAERARRRRAYSDGGWPAWVLALVKHPFRLARLYAAIGAGYTATALQGDTWIIFYEWTTLRIGAHIPMWGVVTGGMGLGTLVYLTAGIQRKTGIGVGAFKRATHIWLYGQAAAILMGSLLVRLIAPTIRYQDQYLISHFAAHPYGLPGTGWSLVVPEEGLLVLLYAQIALFFGVFIQLLFDEKPTTTPLDAP